MAMFKIDFEDEKRFETVRECLEYQIKEQEIVKCYYAFDADGHCGCNLFESIHGHVVEPSDMLRIAEKFFNEFGFVHFEGWGKDGKAYVSCYKAEETEKGFIKRQVENGEKIRHEKILKCKKMKKNGASAMETINFYKKPPKEWEEPLDNDEGEK